MTDELEAGFAEAAARLGVDERTIEVARRPLTLRIAGRSLLERLTPALAHHRRLPGPTGLVVEAWDAAEAGVALPAYPPHAIDGGTTGAQRVGPVPDTRVRYQPDLRALTWYERRRQRAWYCAADGEELPWWELGSPFRTLLAWWLADEDLVLTHAAAIGDESGAALVVGPGGSGKSSTALTCLLAGMGFLGDDYCVVEPHEGVDPLVHTLYGTAKVHADQLARFGDLGRRVLNPERPEGDKALLLPAEVARERLVATAPLAVVLAPQITGRPHTTTDRLSGAATLRALAPSTIFQLPGAGADAFGRLAATVRGVPCYRLGLGTERDEIPPAIASVLADEREPAPR